MTLEQSPGGEPRSAFLSEFVLLGTCSEWPLTAALRSMLIRELCVLRQTGFTLDLRRPLDPAKFLWLVSILWQAAAIVSERIHHIAPSPSS